MNQSPDISSTLLQGSGYDPRKITWCPPLAFGHPLGLSWIELAWTRSSSNFRPTQTKFVTVWPLSQLSPSCFVVFVWLRGRIRTIWVVSCKLARLDGIVWPPADASFDFVTWLELGVSFSQGFSFGDTQEHGYRSGGGDANTRALFRLSRSHPGPRTNESWVSEESILFRNEVFCFKG